MKTSRYVVKIDPKIAGSIADLCPQGSIGCSLSKFIERQYNALERERFELTTQDCIVCLPDEIVDTLEWLYPGIPFSDQVINAVRTLVDLSFPNAHISETDYLHDLADLQQFYASGGESREDLTGQTAFSASTSVPLR